jgi:acyl-ACP thioesterase
VQPHVETFRVRSYEVDAFGALAVPALAGYLQEVAGHHADALGVGLDLLRREGLTWVLSRARIELEAPLRLGDALEIATWPSGLERLAARREFEVRRGGDIVARATSAWFVLDLASRRPVRPERALDPRLPRTPGVHVVDLADGKLPELRHWDIQKRFHVRYEDIDVNEHVTNTSYLTWALEAVPRETWQGSRVRAIEVRFLAECAHGSAILSRAAGAGERSFSHAVVHEEDGRELARVVTEWAPR